MFMIIFVLIYVRNLIVFSLNDERMGGVLSWVQQYFEDEKFVVVLGLDGAGKTALVHRLRFGRRTTLCRQWGFTSTMCFCTTDLQVRGHVRTGQTRVVGVHVPLGGRRDIRGGRRG